MRAWRPKVPAAAISRSAEQTLLAKPFRRPPRPPAKLTTARTCGGLRAASASAPQPPAELPTTTTYADATLKGDFLNAAMNAPVGGGGANAQSNTGVTNLGILANMGERYHLNGGGLYVEPNMSASYIHTSMGNFSTGGAAVGFSDSASIRGGVGARIGTTVPTHHGFSTDFELLAKVWDEFGSPNSVTITDGSGDSENFVDNSFTGVFGELTGTATLYNADRSFSAYLSGGAKFNANFADWNGRLGVRRSF
jgi:outer membrane autotransporter protein